MNQVCVATSKASAYYVLVSRLKKAGLPFTSVSPGTDHQDCDVVLTTADEAKHFGEKAFALEDLGEDPGIFKGQVLSRLGGGGVMLVGVDPGKRTGLAVFYGQTKLAFNTFDSLGEVCSRVGAFAKGIPATRVLVRVGDGDRPMAWELVAWLRKEVPRAKIEVVDESGTSGGSTKMKGVQRDQVAAAKIAFRKGEDVSRAGTKNRG